MEGMEALNIAPKQCVVPIKTEENGRFCGQIFNSGNELYFCDKNGQVVGKIDQRGQQQVVYHGADGQAWIYQVPVVIPEVKNLPKMAIPNPSGLPEDPDVYVNSRQYYRILKRREAREKLVAMGKISLVRKKYMHESRHSHAVKRKRNAKGRFDAVPDKKVKVETVKVGFY